MTDSTKCETCGRVEDSLIHHGPPFTTVCAEPPECHPFAPLLTADVTADVQPRMTILLIEDMHTLAGGGMVEHGENLVHTDANSREVIHRGLTADVQEAPDEAEARGWLLTLAKTREDVDATNTHLDAYAAAVRGEAEARLEVSESAREAERRYATNMENEIGRVAARIADLERELVMVARTKSPMRLGPTSAALAQALTTAETRIEALEAAVRDAAEELLHASGNCDEWAKQRYIISAERALLAAPDAPLEAKDA